MTPDTRPAALDLDGIEARCNAATEGPWEVERWSGGLTVNDGRGMGLVDADDGAVPCFTGDTDAEFVAHARTDVPALVAEVRRLNAHVTELSRVIDGQRDVVRRGRAASQAFSAPSVPAPLDEEALREFIADPANGTLVEFASVDDPQHMISVEDLTAFLDRYAAAAPAPTRQEAPHEFVPHAEFPVTCDRCELSEDVHAAPSAPGQDTEAVPLDSLRGRIETLRNEIEGLADDERIGVGWLRMVVDAALTASAPGLLRGEPAPPPVPDREALIASVVKETGYDRRTVRNVLAVAVDHLAPAASGETPAPPYRDLAQPFLDLIGETPAVDPLSVDCPPKSEGGCGQPTGERCMFLGATCGGEVHYVDPHPTRIAAATPAVDRCPTCEHPWDAHMATYGCYCRCAEKRPTAAGDGA